eukprot:1565798-Amphidinium_carterae.1
MSVCLPIPGVLLSCFLKLVEVASPPGINVVDVKAMMKCATWVVFGEKIYVRVAGVGEKPVRRGRPRVPGWMP